MKFSDHNFAIQNEPLIVYHVFVLQSSFLVASLIPNLMLPILGTLLKVNPTE